MLPQLSESWASTYVQIIMVLMVFGLGLPMAVLSTLSDNVRRLLFRHPEIALHGYAMLMMFYVASLLLYIWVLHPAAGVPVEEWQSWMSSIAISLIIVCSVGYWSYQFNESPFDRIVSYIRTSIRVHEGDRECLRQDDIDDLKGLMVFSRSERELNVVLSCFSDTIQAFLDKRDYRGDELSPLMSAVVAGIAHPGGIGSDKQWRQVGSTLSIVRKTHGIRAIPYNLDLDTASAQLALLAQKAIGRKARQTVLRLLTHGSDNCALMFNVGVGAVKCRDYYLALAALSRIESNITSESDVNTALRAAIGLLSWLAADGGVAGTNVALNRWDRIKQLTDEDPHQLVKSVEGRFAASCDFETSNRVRSFADSVLQS